MKNNQSLIIHHELGVRRWKFLRAQGMQLLRKGCIVDRTYQPTQARWSWGARGSRRRPSWVSPLRSAFTPTLPATDHHQYFVNLSKIICKPTRSSNNDENWTTCIERLLHNGRLHGHQRAQIRLHLSIEWKRSVKALTCFNCRVLHAYPCCKSGSCPSLHPQASEASELDADPRETRSLKSWSAIIAARRDLLYLGIFCVKQRDSVGLQHLVSCDLSAFKDSYFITAIEPIWFKYCW